MASATFTADTTTSWANPERGWYFSAAGMFDSPASFQSNANILVNGTNSLQVNAEPILLMHCYTQLPTSGGVGATNLSNFATNAAYCRTVGLKIILRLFYGNSAADPVLSVIQSQIAQMQAPLYAARDILHVVQCGLIGNFGEWANSANGNDSETNKNAIITAVINAVPPEIFVACREPYFVQKQYPSVKTGVTGFTGGRQGRMASHNDCYLTGDSGGGTPTDSSTFPGPFTVAGMVITTSIASQRQYCAADSEYAPYGGETCNDSQGALNGGMRTGCTDVADGSGIAPNSGAGGIINEGARYRLNYINRAYAPNFVGTNATTGSWFTGGCQGTIYRLLGYRLQITSLLHADTAARGNSIDFVIKLRNVGWSRFHHARRGRITLTNGATVITGLTLQSLRILPAQATTDMTFRATLTIPGGSPTGTYAVTMDFPDIYSNTHRYFKVRPAVSNNGTQQFNDTTRVFTTGTSVTVT